MKIIIRCLFFCAFFITVGQDSIVTISEINIGNLPSNQIKKYWLKLMDNAMSQPVLIPVIVAKGRFERAGIGIDGSNPWK